MSETTPLTSSSQPADEKDKPFTTWEKAKLILMCIVFYPLFLAIMLLIGPFCRSAPQFPPLWFGFWLTLISVPTIQILSVGELKLLEHSTIFNNKRIVLTDSKTGQEVFNLPTVSTMKNFDKKLNIVNSKQIPFSLLTFEINNHKLSLSCKYDREVEELHEALEEMNKKATAEEIDEFFDWLRAEIQKERDHDRLAFEGAQECDGLSAEEARELDEKAKERDDFHFNEIMQSFACQQANLEWLITGV